MKHFFGLLLIIFYSTILSAQSTDSTLEVVSWNIEWFGSGVQGPADDQLQERNVLKGLRFLDADIYGFCEVVDTLRFRRIVDSLGSNYAFFIADFCSLAPFPGDADWLPGQKLAFIYKKSVFSNVKTRAFIRGSGSAYYNFSSGRYPYLLNANVSINGKKRNMDFIMIHGKAGSTNTDFFRRRDAANEMKDTLDASFSKSSFILMGDLNDALEKSISTNASATSSYQSIVADSTGDDFYRSITLPLALAGESSMITFPNVIDHHIISNEVDSMYIKGSVKIRKDIITVVPDYLLRNTSDHYPVYSRYQLKNGDTSVVIINPPPPPPPPVLFSGIKLWPNPFTSLLNLRTGTPLTNCQLLLFNSTGQKVWSGYRTNIPAQAYNDISLPINLAPGLYILRIVSNEWNGSFKLVK